MHPGQLCRDAGQPDHRAAAGRHLLSADRDAGRSVGQHQADGALSLERHLLHAMRGRRLPPHHLFSRPARRDGGLHHAHRGREVAKPRCCSRNGNPVERRRRSRHHAAFRGVARPVSQAVLSVRAGRRQSRLASKTRFVTMSGRKVDAAHLCRARQGRPLRLGDGFAQALDALGRGGVRVRIRPRHLHDRRGLRLQHGGDGEQGPQHLQRQIRARLAPRPRPTMDFASIEAIIAHEYFHNWTGNRITCRDWFQLCLKEGLTVFRDQEFTSDQRSRPVKRIADVRMLRAHQFVEDAGPLAHPVRPDGLSARSTTSTPRPSTRRAPRSCACSRRCSARPDSAAAWTSISPAMTGRPRRSINSSTASPTRTTRDLTQFMRWYAQAGTPEVVASGQLRRGGADLHARARAGDAADARPAGQGADGDPARGRAGRRGRPRHVALAGRRAAGGARRAAPHAARRRPSRSTALPTRPVLSLNRGFSAPIKVTSNVSADDLKFLAAHDSDPFNRWQAVQSLAQYAARRECRGDPRRPRAARGRRPDRGARRGTRRPIARAGLRRADARRCRAKPTSRATSAATSIPTRSSPRGPALRATHRLAARAGAARNLSAACRTTAATVRTPPSAGRRALKNACLDLLAAAGASAIALAARQYHQATNMTDRMAALATLALHDVPERQAAIDDFYRRYRADPLIIDKWLRCRRRSPRPRRSTGCARSRRIRPSRSPIPTACAR